MGIQRILRRAARRTWLVMMHGNLLLSSNITCKSTQRIASKMVAPRSLFSHSVSPSTKVWFELPSVTSSHT